MTTALSVLLPGPQAPADAFVQSPASPCPFSVGVPSPAPRKSLQPHLCLYCGVFPCRHGLCQVLACSSPQSQCVGRVESSP